MLLVPSHSKLADGIHTPSQLHLGDQSFGNDAGILSGSSSDTHRIGGGDFPSSSASAGILSGSGVPTHRNGGSGFPNGGSGGDGGFSLANGDASVKPAYTACAPGRYGPICAGVCACRPSQECDEGPTGSGACACVAMGDHAGREYDTECQVVNQPLAMASGDVRDDTDQLPAAANVGLNRLTFAGSFLQSVRIDANRGRSQRRVENATVSLVAPTPLRSETLGAAPVLMGIDPAAARLLGLDPEELVR